MSAQQAPFRSPMQPTFVRHPSSESWGSPVASPNLGTWGMDLFARNPQCKIRICFVSALRRFRSDFSYEKYHFSYGKTADWLRSPQSLRSTSGTPYAHVPQISCNEKARPHLRLPPWQAASDPHCGPGTRLWNGPAHAAVADGNSYLFRICSCRSGSDFSYENNIFSYGESATQLRGSQAVPSRRFGPDPRFWTPSAPPPPCTSFSRCFCPFLC